VPRALASLPLLFLIVAPPAAADGFREPEVRDAVSAAGFGTIAERVAGASRPVLMLDRELLRREPRALGTSRLGGRPDLPAGTPWPLCHGERQAFLAQVRTRDLPSAAGELRRLGGTLLFFMSVESETVWAGRCATVVHAPRRAGLRRVAPPRGLFRLRPARLVFNLRPDVPDLAESFDRLMTPLRDVRMQDDDWEPWFELRAGLNGNPRFGHQLLGYSRGAYNPDTCTRRADRRSRPWRNLLVIDYDDELGFDIPDGGRLHVLISPGDLRAGRFQRTCSYFDTT
jgi:hypothetical protein